VRANHLFLLPTLSHKLEQAKLESQKQNPLFKLNLCQLESVVGAETLKNVFHAWNGK